MLVYPFHLALWILCLVLSPLNVFGFSPEYPDFIVFAYSIIIIVSAAITIFRYDKTIDEVLKLVYVEKIVDMKSLKFRTDFACLSYGFLSVLMFFSGQIYFGCIFCVYAIFQACIKASIVKKEDEYKKAFID